MPGIAITGTAGFVGHMVLQSLVARGTPDRPVVVDCRPPRVTPHHYTYQDCDLTQSEASAALAALLHRHRCHTIIHAALPTQPWRDLEAMHELQSIGTMHLLYAAEKAQVRQLILASTTDVYGAFPDNPNFLVESHPLRGSEMSTFLRDKIDVERQFTRYADAHPQCTVTILRPCTILGPTVHNYKTNFLQHPIIPTVLGYDPLVQFVHEHDVARAFTCAIAKRHAGAVNIVGAGVIPLSRALAMARRLHVPIAYPLFQLTAALCWHANISDAPAAHINFLKYPCIADGERARRHLGFTPVYSSQEALLSFVHTNRV